MFVEMEIRGKRFGCSAARTHLFNKINRWIVWKIAFSTFAIDTYAHHQAHTDQRPGCGTNSSSHPRNLFVFGPAMSALPIRWEHYQQTGCGGIHQQRRSSRGHHCCHCWCDLVARNGAKQVVAIRILSAYGPLPPLFGCRRSWIWSSWRSTWRKVMRNAGPRNQLSKQVPADKGGWGGHLGFQFVVVAGWPECGLKLKALKPTNRGQFLEYQPFSTRRVPPIVNRTHLETIQAEIRASRMLQVIQPHVTHVVGWTHLPVSPRQRGSWGRRTVWSWDCGMWGSSMSQACQRFLGQSIFKLWFSRDSLTAPY